MSFCMCLDMRNSINENGVEAGIHTNYVLICVVKPIEVDAKSEYVPVSQN